MSSLPQQPGSGVGVPLNASSHVPSPVHIESQRVAAQLVFAGYWGEPTATYDFCEANYSCTNFTAEFFNTLSSFPLCFCGVIGMVNCVQHGYEGRFFLANMMLALAGLSSVAFHCTLLRQAQVMDELSLLWVSLSILFCAVTVTEMPRMRQQQAYYGGYRIVRCLRKLVSFPLTHYLFLAYGILGTTLYFYAALRVFIALYAACVLLLVYVTLKRVLQFDRLNTAAAIECGIDKNGSSDALVSSMASFSTASLFSAQSRNSSNSNSSLTVALEEKCGDTSTRFDSKMALECIEETRRHSELTTYLYAFTFLALLFYTGGFLFLWLPERVFCGNRLHNTHFSWLMHAQLHAWFHLCTAIAAYCWLVALLILRQGALRNKNRLVFVPCNYYCNVDVYCSMCCRLYYTSRRQRALPYKPNPDFDLLCGCPSLNLPVVVRVKEHRR